MHILRELGTKQPQLGFCLVLSAMTRHWGNPCLYSCLLKKWSKGPFPRSLETCRLIQSSLESRQAPELFLGWGKAKCLVRCGDNCGFLALPCAEFNTLGSFLLWKVFVWQVFTVGVWVGRCQEAHCSKENQPRL